MKKSQKKNIEDKGRSWKRSIKLVLLLVAVVALLVKVMISLGLLSYIKDRGSVLISRTESETTAQSRQNQHQVASALKDSSGLLQEAVFSSPAGSPLQVTGVTFFEKREAELNRREQELRMREETLKKMEEDIQKKFQELSALQKEIQDYRAEKASEKSGRIRSLVRIYETMKPREAANLLENMEEALVVSIISNMNTEAAASILAVMDAKKAAKISQILSAP